MNLKMSTIVDDKNIRKIEFENYLILVGKNAQINDVLTFDIAKDDDLWFHASGVPGSHVISVSRETEIPKMVINKAAELAAINSKGRGDVKVVYTQRKNVTKLPKQNPGQVMVNYEKSIFINITI
jgi:predicted ribosome quality control (RQC) complex YloA/Tae2 family protein